MAALNKATPLTKWLAKWGKVQKEEREIRERLPSFLSVMEYDSGSVGVFSCSRSIWFCEDPPLAQFTDSDHNGIWDLRGEIRWQYTEEPGGLPFMGSHRVKCSNAQMLHRSIPKWVRWWFDWEKKIYHLTKYSCVPHLESCFFCLLFLRLTKYICLQ